MQIIHFCYSKAGLLYMTKQIPASVIGSINFFFNFDNVVMTFAHKICWYLIVIHFGIFLSTQHMYEEEKSKHPTELISSVHAILRSAIVTPQPNYFSRGSVQANRGISYALLQVIRRLNIITSAEDQWSKQKHCKVLLRLSGIFNIVSSGEDQCM